MSLPGYDAWLERPYREHYASEDFDPAPDPEWEEIFAYESSEEFDYQQGFAEAAERGEFDGGGQC